MKKFLSLIAILTIFSFQRADACEELERSVNAAQKTYDEAHYKAFELEVEFNRKAPSFLVGMSPDSKDGEKIYELQEKVVAARIDAEQKYEKLQEEKRKLEECLSNHDRCISCNGYIPAGDPYYHKTFCSDYLLQVHAQNYPTGRYWTCNSSEVNTHMSRTCSRTAYGGSGETCGQTYRNCVPRVCRHQRSYGSTLYCNEYAY